LLVVVGGDGAVNEVVHGVAGREGVEIAVVPRGTGMDFGRTYGIPAKAEDALDVAAGGSARTIDLGRVRYRTWGGDDAEGWFANIASAGMSGAVARRANSTSKAMGGKVSFFIALVAVFARWKNVEVDVRLEGAERRGLVSNVIVANGQYQGGNMWIAPEAQPDDGLFDVLVIGDITKPDFVRNVGRIYRGTHLTHPKIELLRSPWVEVDADQPLPIELDGEQPGTTPVRFEIVPGALRVRVPTPRPSGT
jgi:diacylglycerol kinase (ATP)